MRLLMLVMSLLLLSGCAHRVFSPEALKLVDPKVSFQMLKQNPEQYAGKHLLLGGAIAKVKNTEEGGVLEVVEFPVTDDGRPKDSVASRGRFIAETKMFLDPLIFKPGMQVSLIGEARGRVVRSLEGLDYPYPLVAVKELYLWKPETGYRAGPVFHFGLGVFHSF